MENGPLLNSNHYSSFLFGSSNDETVVAPDLVKVAVSAAHPQLIGQNGQEEVSRALAGHGRVTEGRGKPSQLPLGPFW